MGVTEVVGTEALRQICSGEGRAKGHACGTLSTDRAEAIRTATERPAARLCLMRHLGDEGG